MYREISLEQGTPEWHEYRAMHIGASDASKIMGLSPWGNAASLYKEKIGLRAILPNSSMIRGLELEDPARACLKAQCGLSVKPIVIESNIFPWMSASLDGITDDGQIVEIKCPGEKDHGFAVRGMIPKHYIPQLQHQMYVSGVQFAWYYSFDGFDGILLKCLRDDDFIADMIDAEKQFYERLMNFDAPESKADLYLVNSEPEFEALATTYRRQSMQVTEYQELLKQKLAEIDGTKELILAICQGKDTKGFGLTVKKTSRKGIVDYTKIPELRGVDLEKYRKEGSTSWKLEID